MEPLRRWAEHVIDTTDTAPNALQQQIRQRFGSGKVAPTLSVMSFGFARGIPRNADNVFDLRFLRNPYWVDSLRDLTGLDSAVGDYVAGDEAYGEAVTRIEDLLLVLLPRYRGGRKILCHDRLRLYRRKTPIASTSPSASLARLREAGFSPTVEHRDLASPPRDGVEGGGGGKPQDWEV